VSSGLNLSLSSGLKRIGIAYKRGRDALHRPDPDYFQKRLQIEACFQEALHSQGNIAWVFLDGVGSYRQPSLAQAYEEKETPSFWQLRVTDPTPRPGSWERTIHSTVGSSSIKERPSRSQRWRVSFRD
jgi:hypothetical protein